MRHAPRLFRLLTTIWVGSLLTIGYAVAPILFVALDRASAGGVAARLFRIEGLIGVVCAVLMLLIAQRARTRGRCYLPAFAPAGRRDAAAAC